MLENELIQKEMGNDEEIEYHLDLPSELPVQTDPLTLILRFYTTECILALLVVSNRRGISGKCKRRIR